MNKKNLTIVKSVVFPIAGVLTLGAGVGIGVAIKTNSQSELLAGASTTAEFNGNDLYGYWTFTLRNELSDGQYLQFDLKDDEYFLFETSNKYIEVQGRVVNVPIIRIKKAFDERSKTVQSTYNPTFTCYDKNNNPLWSKQINDCKVIYKPCIRLADEETKQKIYTTDDLTSDKHALKCEYNFTLAEPLGSYLEQEITLECDIQNYSPYQPQNKTVEVDGLNVKLSFELYKTGSVWSPGDNASPTFTFNAKWGDTTWWQSNKFTGFNASYFLNEVDIDPQALLFDKVTEDGTTYAVLKGVDTDKLVGDENCLLIPTTYDGCQVKYVGYKNGDNYEPLLGLVNNSDIAKVKFSGLGVLETYPNAFNGVSIKCLDLSIFPDTVKSLDSVTLGSNSFNFKNQAADIGMIIWNTNFSQYKKHILKEKLYNAGLTTAAWYGIKSVDSIDALKEAAYTGGFIQLAKDLVIDNAGTYTGQIDFYESCVLDLNGYTITSKAPIYNIETAEYSVIGVWDTELLVTDTSTEERVAGRGAHGGGIYAYDQTGLGTTEHPQPEKPDPLYPHAKDDQYWTWNVDKQKFSPRESRCFYCRSDIPSRAKGTLEILAGKYYGNCTCVFNYNTVCYIEDEYSPETGTYAPEFHIYTPYFSTVGVYTSPAQELLNCLESTFWSGEAYFDIYGGKFFSKMGSDSNWGHWKPTEAPGDTSKEGRHPDYVNDYKWEEYKKYYEYKTILVTEGVDNPYYLVTQTPRQ